MSKSIIKNILTLTHDDSHIEFDRTYNKIVNLWYIREFSKHLTSYLKHCFQCRINRTRRYKSYKNLQFILSSSISFHFITIDFVLKISESHIDINNIMFVTNKFNKRIIIISNKNTWIATLWIEALLKKLNVIDWNFSKIIISNRNRKFLSKLWFTLFVKFDVKLLYFTTYYSQIDESFEQINQTLKIVFRYHIQALTNYRDWSSIVEIM